MCSACIGKRDNVRQMKKVLITGIAGPDGCRLAKTPLETVYYVHGLVRRKASISASDGKVRAGGLPTQQSSTRRTDHSAASHTVRKLSSCAHAGRNLDADNVWGLYRKHGVHRPCPRIAAATRSQVDTNCQNALLP